MKHRLLPHAALLLACAAPGAVADDSDKPFKHELKPSILHASAFDLWAPALQFDLGWHKDGSTGSGGVSHYFRARSEGTVATDSRANSENLFAEIEAGLNWEATRVGSNSPSGSGTQAGVGMKMEEDAGGKEARRYGNVTLTGAARFETDQGLDNYNATYGANLGYVHRNGDTQPLWSLVPKIQLRYHYVDVIESREFDRRGIDDDSFWRLDALADWTFKVGKWIDPNYDAWYGGFYLGAALKYYRGFEMPDGAEAADLDESWYYSGSVYYRFKDGSRVAKWISATYLTVGYGRIPPAVVEQTHVFLGVVLNFD